MIYSLVQRRAEDVKPGEFETGVTRFDSSLRQVFPEMESITPAMIQARAFVFDRDDVVITDNGLSLLVPVEVSTVVTAHGCALTHYERDPHWRNEQTRNMCVQQREMFRRPNRTYVAPSAWVRGEFARHIGLPPDYAEVIVNYVDPIKRPHPLPGARRPVVIGDWRDSNKGAHVWQKVAALLPECDFRPCSFTTGQERIAFYQQADLYLCLSLSEGGSYSMCDAEAAGLEIVSTQVGNCAEFGAHPLSLLHVREKPEAIAQTIRHALAKGSGHRRGYFDKHGFEEWATSWRSVVGKARSGSEALL